MALDTTPVALQTHARDLAKAFNVRLIEAAQLQPEEAIGLFRLRVALVSPVIDETTYAVALHEMGHLVSPTGAVRHVATGDLRNLLLIEEEAAWTWARHYALIWTPLMESLAVWAIGTYSIVQPQPRSVDPPAAPTTPARPSINWNDWK